MRQKAKVLSKFDPTDPLFVNRTQYAELWGGLGDIFNHVHWVHCYQNLDLLTPEERVYIVCSSHNSCAHEIFAWHPKADQITIANPGFLINFNNDDWRRKVGLPVPKGCTNHHPRGVATTYYPSPDELPFVERLASSGKYVVFSLMASDVGRSIPKAQAEAAARLAIAKGYRVVLVGRNYTFHVAEGQSAIKRFEHRIVGKGIEDAIDALTVPGMAKVVRRSSGVFTCHSAVCMLAWHMRKPTYLSMDPSSNVRYFPPYHSKYEGYSFGGAFPKNASHPFSEYSDPRFTGWLEGISS